MLDQLVTLTDAVRGRVDRDEQPDLTIGMLVAFQMFAGRLSRPLLQMVSLWQEFQNASIAVKRIGDVMNAPTSPIQ